VRLGDFDYDLADDRIAQVPVEPRDAARLLVDRGSRAPEHRHIRDLPELLHDGDVLVVNETKVLPARLALRRATGGAAEVLLLEAVDATRRTWEALVRPARRLRAGEVLQAADGEAVVRIGERTAAGDTILVELLGPVDGHDDLDDLVGPDDLEDLDADLEIPDALARHGEMPLPPYITQPLADPGRYQTVYAKHPGSAAAPTAGLHLTEDLMARLAARGIETLAVELVVGLDTFQPVSVEDPAEHRMHTERYRVPPGVLDRCRDARRVVAVGTTSVRALESAAATGRLDGRTDLFIRRGFEWRVVDVLLTNFHLPRTTLLMMIDAFVGARWRRLYDVAIAEGYRFLSFGDAMLLDRRAA
jgi:S-adenosylmethionine:tRNA ribosyltransferase-isomerase